MSDSTSDRDPIEMLADSFLARFRRGERPSVEDYAAQHPELADEIRELLPALVMLEQDKSAAGPAADTIGSPDATASGPAPHQLGDYLILREIGRGGMGVVYESVQQSLGRHVALKVLLNQVLSGSSQLERFRLEARAAARLHHTNIVPVFGVGECEGVHYYAMQFIQGQALDVVIDALRKLRDGGPAIGAGSETPGTAGGDDQPLTAVLSRALLTGRFAAAQPGPEPTAATDESFSSPPSQGPPGPASPDRANGPPRPMPPAPPNCPPVRPARRTSAASPASASRWPRRWPTPTARGFSTATSSPPTCCWTPRGPCGSPTSGWPRPRGATA